MKQPSEIDLSDNLQSTFGMCEYEYAACDIIRWLASDEQADIGWWLDYNQPWTKSGWGKLFKIDSVPNVDNTLFAMMCAAGWINENYFPKGTFYVSKEFIERVTNRKKGGYRE